jgi:hypothetical protein
LNARINKFLLIMGYGLRKMYGLLDSKMLWVLSRNTAGEWPKCMG